MENAIRKGYERLATKMLKDFNEDWVKAIIFHNNESDFNELRKFFATENYELFCNLCGVNAENWKNFLENLKIRACTDKKLYATLQEQWYKQQHNKEFYDDLLLEQQEQM